MQYVQYFDIIMIIMIEWLASRISGLGRQYDDRKTHENGWGKCFRVEAVV